MNQYDQSVGLYQLLTPILILTALLLYALSKLKLDRYGRKKAFTAPPSPLSLPIVGHLYLLAKFPSNPWLAFNAIREKYGNIVHLMLGQVRTVMVSSPHAMREVLLVKGDVFCDRPSFYRHTLIFGGDKENSLALCNWSDLQRLRRSMAQMGILPRYGSNGYNKLAKCIDIELKQMIYDLKTSTQIPFLTKGRVLAMCANIFLNYLCSRKFSVEDSAFAEALYKYDLIFYDINQCYAVDFIPYLSVFGTNKRYFKHVRTTADQLRKYIEDEVAVPRMESIVKRIKQNEENDSECGHNANKDFLEMMLEHYIRNPNEMSWTTCMFEIGDLIGGHSAVGNLLMRLIGHLAVNEDVQQSIYEEAVSVLQRFGDEHETITLAHRPYMPLTEASILETLRIASSPIVPHVASQDTTLQGYDIEKGTMILFNTYHLNMSSKYWTDPHRFDPSRFVVTNGDSRHIIKPDHFFPFSSGRRACLGYKMVNTITFATIANLVLNFKIYAHNDSQSKQITQSLASIGCLALTPDNCFKAAFTPRATRG